MTHHARPHYNIKPPGSRATVNIPLPGQCQEKNSWAPWKDRIQLKFGNPGSPIVYWEFHSVGRTKAVYTNGEGRGEETDSRQTK